MKLSLNWIFTHLARSVATIDVPELIKLINQKVVEIDRLHPLTLNPHMFMLVQNTKDGFKSSTNVLPLPKRADAVINHWYLITTNHDVKTWTTVKDLGGTKETLIPALTLINNSPAETLQNIAWNDYIIEISSSAITHRPDLWGHRGFAREISVLLDIPLKPIDDLCLQTAVVHRTHEKKSEKIKDFPFSIARETESCSRFAAAFVPTVTQKPSICSVAFLLSRVDIRPINAVVDGTNVVMMDLGHPMHAFDSNKIHGQSIIIGQNNTGFLKLLDGQEIECQPNDIIIRDSSHILSLAGIMGGLESSVQPETESLLIEAAVFDASTIRTSAAYHKKRTEASARFEKRLDPEQPVWAIKRYLKYALEHSLIPSAPACIIDSGNTQSNHTITIDHQTIERLLGVAIDYRFILKTLNGLEYTVTCIDDTYTVQVPSFRRSDICIKEDIVEEIGRLYGYWHIKPQAPAITRTTHVDYNRSTSHAVTSLLSFGMHMHEIKSYAFFDESFLHEIQWPTDQTAEVHTPVSQNWKCLINTLIPGLLKAVTENSAQKEKAAFFEIGTVWTPYPNEKRLNESLHLGLIHAEEDYSFYDGKKILHTVNQLYGIDPLWIGYNPDNCPLWLMPYQSAQLMVDGTFIGYAGLLHYEIRNRLAKHIPNSIFVAEISLDKITHLKKQLPKFKMSSRFQPVTRDINIWTPKSCSAQTLINTIKSTTSLIRSVSIVDFLEKDEWSNHRAITLRVIIESHEKTFTKEEIDLIMVSITEKIIFLKAEVK